MMLFLNGTNTFMPASRRDVRRKRKPSNNSWIGSKATPASKTGGLSWKTSFGMTGTVGASLKRPGSDRLRDQAAARELDLVLITAPDRLARNYVHQVLLLEELEHIGRAELIDRQGWIDIHVVAEHSRRFILHRVYEAFARRHYTPKLRRRS